MTAEVAGAGAGRLRLRHDSLRTEQMSVGWMGRFILVNGERHSARMGQAAQIHPHVPWCPEKQHSRGRL
ncbi:hypothetical protein [Xanthomonas sacchari]|uniref:hypothetical protein n=1 Tax=Xanthomonas sacchari TaxID=56458 RepID=UPI003D2F6530